MSDTLRHRGPDGEGQWVSEDRLCGLSHRRLSIIDLSAAGAQPMVSHRGNHVIVFNGEIYNFEELRGEVELHRGQVAWRGHSDTEVLLELIAELGVAEAINKVDGMFSLAVYDRESKVLTLARDAFGEKPLYYGLCGNALVFGSELRALKAFPGFAAQTNATALADYFKYTYIPAPATIYEGVFKLPAAHILVVRPDDIMHQHLPDAHKWWDVSASAMLAKNCPFSGTYEDAIIEVRRVLQAAAKRRLVADVPVGTFLSGGIDSSLVTSLIQSSVNTPIKTFSIGMEDTGFNEAPYAHAVAAHLRTDHHELILQSRTVQSVIPQIAASFDEPFADSSQIPTYLVSKAAREHVTVALSGDGGDELFGGYNRHFHAPAIWARLEKWPRSARRTAASIAAAVRPERIDRLVALTGGTFASRELAGGRAGEKIHKLARVMAARDITEFHDGLLAVSNDAGLALSGQAAAQNLAMRGDNRLEFAERAMLADTCNYLPDDVLVKVDRASMAVSLEMRTPFLSRELFSLAWSLPFEFKSNAGQGKRILRDLLYKMVPRELADRPKSGFAVPVGRWLRTGLREWAEEGLSSAALQRASVFNVEEVRRRWTEHLAGRRDHQSFLWAVLMYQDWSRSAAYRHSAEHL